MGNYDFFYSVEVPAPGDHGCCLRNDPGALELHLSYSIYVILAISLENGGAMEVAHIVVLQ